MRQVEGELRVIRDHRDGQQEKRYGDIKDPASGGPCGTWADRQPERPSLREATRVVLRDAVEICRRYGRSREWALRRIADSAGVHPTTVGQWLKDGVPEGRRKGALYEGGRNAVRLARQRHALLGGGLRRKREALGLTQRELAHKVRVKKATLSAWERGESEPCARNLEKLDATIKRLIQARG